MIRSLLRLKPGFKYEVAICCIAKNEDAYLVEWIEYHLLIGVTRFYIYDNESAVPIATTLDSYIRKGIVKVELIPGRKKQIAAHKHCLANYGRECQWIAFIDVDEYIVPKNDTCNLVEFLNAYNKFGGLAIHWLLFGSNGHLEPPSTTQINSYTRRSLKTHEMNCHIKTIVQPKHVKWVPKDPHHFGFRFGKYCVNENFEKVKGPLAEHTSNKIQLNHYFVRSLEEFKAKVARGRADVDEMRTVDEFYEVNEYANLLADENIIELKLMLDEKQQRLSA